MHYWLKRQIKENKFLSDNSTSQNILLLLFLLSFIIICIDLNLEISVEREEIETAVVILSDTKVDLFVIPVLGVEIPVPLTGIIILDAPVICSDSYIMYLYQRPPPLSIPS